MPAGSSGKKYDVIVIGGGHNGLTNAAYLAKAGKKVLVLERRHILGGAPARKKFFPASSFRFARMWSRCCGPRSFAISIFPATDWRFCRWMALSLPCPTAITCGA